jgi:fructose-specific phosphotransferase system component IIB
MSRPPYYETSVMHDGHEKQLYYGKSQRLAREEVTHAEGVIAASSSTVDLVMRVKLPHQPKKQIWEAHYENGVQQSQTEVAKA